MRWVGCPATADARPPRWGPTSRHGKSLNSAVSITDPFNVKIYNIKLLAAIESQGRSPRQTKGLPCMPRHDMDSIDDLLAQWKRAGTAFDPLTEGVLGRLVRLGRYLTRLLSDSAAAYDLSGEEWEALSVLKRVRGEAEATPGRMAQDLSLTP